MDRDQIRDHVIRLLAREANRDPSRIDEDTRALALAGTRPDPLWLTLIGQRINVDFEVAIPTGKQTLSLDQPFPADPTVRDYVDFICRHLDKP